MARKYTIIPTAAGPFAGLDLASRAIFGLIWDRWQLSKKTNEEAGHGYTAPVKTSWAELRYGIPTKRRAFSDEDYNKEIEISLLYCVLRQSEIMAETGLCERTVRRCIRDLEAAKIMKIERAGIKGANRYFILHHVELYFNKAYET